MKFLDLFAGIGGFRRGLELAGHDCVGFCEFNKFAVASYKSMHLLTHQQRTKLKDMPLKKRQKEILKDEYRNGEWFANDIRDVRAQELPNADCWCFGAPCQDFSISGKRKGMAGDRSSLVREVFRILEEFQEKDRPEWLIYENVKGMLSSNRGLDYLSILSEMDRLGYDIEWQNINSRWFVPQNRERIYTVGHLRRYGSAKILPIKGADGENSISMNKRKYCFFADMNYGAGIHETECARALQARYYKGINNRSGENSCVAIPVLTSNRHGMAIGIIDTQGRKGKKIEPKEICPTLRSETHGNIPQVCIDITGKLGGQEREQGIFVEMPEGFVVYAIWSEKYHCYLAMRKLTPKECFRLQGWNDDYFERAAMVCSDTQLYKQAGNGVTVPVIEVIGKEIAKYERKSV